MVGCIYKDGTFVASCCLCSQFGDVALFAYTVCYRQREFLIEMRLLSPLYNHKSLKNKILTIY